MFSHHHEVFPSPQTAPATLGRSRVRCIESGACGQGVGVRVYLEGTGEGDALTAFAQLSRAATARKLAIRIEDPVAFEKGSGRFYVHVENADTREDAIAMVRAALDQAPDAAAAFELAPE